MATLLRLPFPSLFSEELCEQIPVFPLNRALVSMASTYPSCYRDNIPSKGIGEEGFILAPHCGAAQSIMAGQATGQECGVIFEICGTLRGTAWLGY